MWAWRSSRCHRAATAAAEAMLGAPRHAVRQDVLARRRGFEDQAKTWGYCSLSDVGFDGPWVSPIQMLSGHPTGPVLLAKDYLDVPSLRARFDEIAPRGYLPGNPFNAVIDRALARVGMAREDVYIAQCFAAIVPQHRSTNIPMGHLRASFEAVAQHELRGRQVIALGPAASRLCTAFEIAHHAVAYHPSARGKGVTFDVKAGALADALTAAV